MKQFRGVTILVFAFVVTLGTALAAEGTVSWGQAGIPVCLAPGDQKNLRMVPDGSGGAILVWEDWRSGNADIYAQRIKKDGTPMWNPYDGVAISTTQFNQKNPVIISDGEGGAIIAWEDYRSGATPSIYALRISSETGMAHPQWSGGNIIKLSSNPVSARFPEIVTDGSGGAVVLWQEWNTDVSIVAQRVTGEGSLSWGTILCNVVGDECDFPVYRAIYDGAQGVIVVWESFDYGTQQWEKNIYAVKINTGEGDLMWNSNVCESTGEQRNPRIIPDGEGGAIIVWEDSREGNCQIYSQWIKSDGSRFWQDSEVQVSSSVANAHSPAIICDLVGGTTVGAIVAWEDRRNGNADIYALKITTHSAPLPGSERLIVGGLLDELAPQMVSDNTGGGFIVWREQFGPTASARIFVSRRGSEGNPIWDAPAVRICEEPYIEGFRMIPGETQNEVIIAWVGGYPGNYNIYAQKVVETTSSLPAIISGYVLTLKIENLQPGWEPGPSDFCGITGVELEALMGGKVVSRDFSENGLYELGGLSSGFVYEVRATWEAECIVTSVSLLTKAPNYSLLFSLEESYILGSLEGIISGVSDKNMVSSSLRSERMNKLARKKLLSPGNGIAFVELKQRGKVIARVPVEPDGTYRITNLLPGRFVARAYNGRIYSEPKVVNIRQGETLRVNFAFATIPEDEVYNYPNPARESTTIRYYCGYNEPVSEIKIYNLSGELVREVKDKEIDKSRADKKTYSFVWDLKNDSGKYVASGVYVYVIEVKEKDSGETAKVVKKMAVLR